MPRGTPMVAESTKIGDFWAEAPVTNGAELPNLRAFDDRLLIRLRFSKARTHRQMVTGDRVPSVNRPMQFVLSTTDRRRCPRRASLRHSMALVSLRRAQRPRTTRAHQAATLVGSTVDHEGSCLDEVANDMGSASEILQQGGSSSSAALGHYATD